MAYDGVELAEGGEAEEGVDYVGRQLDRGLPFFPEIGDDLQGGATSEIVSQTSAGWFSRL